MAAGQSARGTDVKNVNHCTRVHGDSLKATPHSTDGHSDGLASQLRGEEALGAEPPPEHHNPVDTGWSWVILIAVFVIQFVSAGFLRALGLLFVAIQCTFRTSASMIAIIGGVESATFSLTAVLCMSVLLDVISVRRCTLIGALVGTCGLMASFLASTITTLIFSFSVCLGIGMGLSMAPGYILLNVYFRQKRPLATALANTGSSVGSIVMPMVTRVLLEEYYLSGALLLLGGVYAQILVFGALFTPPSEYRQRKSHVFPDDSSPGEEDELKWEPFPSVQASDVDPQTCELQRQDSESRILEAKPETEWEHSSLEPRTKSLTTINRQLFPCPGNALTASDWRGSWSERLSMNSLITAASLTNLHVVSLTRIDTVLKRKDTTRSKKGLIANLLQTSEQDREEDFSYSLESEDVSSSNSSRTFRFKSCRVCDPSLYRSVVFWLLACYHFTGNLVCNLPSAYLPALAQEKGLTLTQGALLLTICGCLDIVSRLVPGVLAQWGLLKPQTSVAVSLVVLGVIFQLTAVVEGMAGMVVVSVVYGLFSGAFWSMLQIIILDFSDLEKFRQVFSITQLSLGASGVIGYLIVGNLRDLNGSYTSSFHFMGACGLLSAALLLMMPAVQRRQAARHRSSSSSSRARSSSASAESVVLGNV